MYSEMKMKNNQIIEDELRSLNQELEADGNINLLIKDQNNIIKEKLNQVDTIDSFATNILLD